MLKRISRTASVLCPSVIVGVFLVSQPILANADTRATGAISLNGQPAPHRTINLWHPADKTRITTVTDDNGQYTVSLPNVGKWMISIRGWSQTAQFIAVEGSTQFDWAVEGGSLQVTLVGAREPTDVTIRRASPDFLAMRKIAATDSTYVFEAIPFGTFGIRAANRFGKSQIATVTFTATQALQHVRLEFPDK